jgi:hypothetical protein
MGRRFRSAVAIVACLCAGGRLTQVASGPARWRFVAATDCSRFPEVEVNVTGRPLQGSSPTGRVRGFLDDTSTRGPPHGRPQIVNDMANGAEAYLRMWARTEAAARR